MRARWSTCLHFVRVYLQSRKQPPMIICVHWKWFLIMIFFSLYCLAPFFPFFAERMSTDMIQFVRYFFSLSLIIHYTIEHMVPYIFMLLMITIPEPICTILLILVKWQNIHTHSIVKFFFLWLINEPLLNV